jgi:hypothetical protein
MSVTEQPGPPSKAKPRGRPYVKGEGGRPKGSPNKSLNPRDGRLVNLGLPPFQSAADGPRFMAAVWNVQAAAKITAVEATTRFNLLERMIREFVAAEEREAERAAKVRQPIDVRFAEIFPRLARAEARLARIRFSDDPVVETPKPWEDAPTPDRRADNDVVGDRLKRDSQNAPAPESRAPVGSSDTASRPEDVFSSARALVRDEESVLQPATNSAATDNASLEAVKSDESATSEDAPPPAEGAAGHGDLELADADGVPDADAVGAVTAASNDDVDLVRWMRRDAQYRFRDVRAAIFRKYGFDVRTPADARQYLAEARILPAGELKVLKLRAKRH